MKELEESKLFLERKKLEKLYYLISRLALKLKKWRQYDISEMRDK